MKNHRWNISERIICIFLVGMLTLFLPIETAQACIGPHQRLFPTCEISAPRTDERVSLIYTSTGAGLSSSALSNEELVTELVDVVIEAAEKPHYIALSSGKPMIWRFSGAIDQISRVMVFGSQLNGAKQAGVMGVPDDRVFFVKTNLDALNSHNRNSCQSTYKACELSAYFKIPIADRMQLVGEEKPQRRFKVQQFVERLKGNVIRIPKDGWSEAQKRGRWKTVGNITKMTGPAAGRYEIYGGGAYSETGQSYTRGVIEVEPSSVLSPVDVKPYSILPSEYGLQQLIDRGALLPANDPRFRKTYDQWNSETSRPFQSIFDPNFLFSFDIDYLITKPTRLPAALSKKTFLIAGGVVSPDMGGNHRSSACLFFENPKNSPKITRSHQSPNCDQQFTMALTERDRALVSELQTLKRMRKHNSVSNAGSCKRLDIDADAYFVGISASEGSSWRAGYSDTSRRRLEIDVARPGKVALFLDMHGGRTDWHIFPSAKTEIVNVVLQNIYLGERADKAFIDNIVHETNSLRGGFFKSKCKAFHPTSQAYLGGPAALQLNESLKILTGRELDHMVRVTNDRSWPDASVSATKAPVRIAIE